MNMDLYFPTPVWWEQTDIDTAPMLDLGRRLKENDPQGRRLSNEGGWQSMDFRPGTHLELKPIEDKIMQQAHQCVLDFGYRTDLCFPVLENLWFNFNYQHNSNMVHIHDSSFVSGAFYLKAVPGQGKITMYKDFNQDYLIMSQAPVAQFTTVSASAISYEPNTGKLVMFPGWLPHGVGANTLNEERVSLSFNVKLIRTDDERYWTTIGQRNQPALRG